MIQIVFLFLKNYFNVFLRKCYWLYRLSQIKFGRGISLNFPIKVEGKGSISLGNQCLVGKNVSLGVAVDGVLQLGNNTDLQNDVTILIGEGQSLKIDDNFKLGQGSRLYVQNYWEIGKAVQIETNCAIFSRESGFGGRLKIGDNSHIADYTIIDMVQDVFIGKDVAIGPNCTLYTHDHIYTDKNLPAWKGGIIVKSIFIEDGAWIGSGVTILPGITIGKRAVVAAGSVVTKSIEPETIYGGIPAKFIKSIE